MTMQYRIRSASLNGYVATATSLGLDPDTMLVAVGLARRMTLDPDTLIAFEMNGEPLPKWNGAPARLVAPGWTATYWIKALADLTVTDKPFDGFWMKTAYRVPKGMFGASGFES